MDNEKLLKRYFEEVVRDFEKIKLKENVSDIKINKRLITTLGQYHPDTKVIDISYRLLETRKKKNIMNVIAHEICHNIYIEKYGDDDAFGGHTKEWHQIANYVNENTKYKILVKYPISLIKN